MIFMKPSAAFVNRPGFGGDFLSWKDDLHAEAVPEGASGACRLLAAKHRGKYETEYAAIRSVAANWPSRFYSDVPGCSQMVNSIGTDLAPSHCKAPDRAGYVPCSGHGVAAGLLARPSSCCCPRATRAASPGLPRSRPYFDANFVQLKSPWRRVTLYKRKDFDLRAARRVS